MRCARRSGPFAAVDEHAVVDHDQRPDDEAASLRHNGESMARHLHQHRNVLRSGFEPLPTTDAPPTSIMASEKL